MEAKEYLLKILENEKNEERKEIIKESIQLLSSTPRIGRIGDVYFFDNPIGKGIRFLLPARRKEYYCKECGSLKNLIGEEIPKYYKYLGNIYDDSGFSDFLKKKYLK